MDDAKEVLSALRLGWSVAEMRGRNNPGGPSGDISGMPDHIDHPLPLRIERGKTELRIEVQSVVAELAQELRIDDSAGHTSLTAALGDKAKLLSHIRAPKAADALQQALDLLQPPAADPAARQAVEALQQAIAATPETAAQAGIDCVRQCQQNIADAVRRTWAELAELIWQFDAHAQDRLAAFSESQAIGYQLGRGLADTYWALDPAEPGGSAGWGFLLGERRCNELSRLTGRLAAYMVEYTAPAIAGSLEVWKAVVKAPPWLGDPRQADLALYSQIRRWFELIILSQDPTTLIGPAAVMKDYHTLRRALNLFWPELLATIVGFGFLIALLFLISAGAAGWAKTLSAILAAVGFSLAGLTGTLKNSAQALLKRLRQDAYTDLVALAVQTAPPPPRKSDLQDAIRRRQLTPATPN